MRQLQAKEVIDLIDEAYQLIDQAESKFKSAEFRGADVDLSENQFQELYLTMKSIIQDANEVLEEAEAA